MSSDFTTQVSIGGLDQFQRRDLENQLRAEGIDGEWLGDSVRVDQAYEARVESLVETSRAGATSEMPLRDDATQPYAAQPYATTPYPPAPDPASTPYGLNPAYPPPSYPAQYGPVQYGPSPYGPSPYPGYFAGPVTNSNATLALIFGILSIAVCGLCCIPGIIYGNKARAEIKASNGMQTGDGMALAGLIISYIYAGVVVLAIVGFIAVFAIAALSSGPTY